MKTYKRFAAMAACMLFMVSMVAQSGKIDLNDQFKTSIDKDKVEVPKQN